MRTKMRTKEHSMPRSRRAALMAMAASAAALAALSPLTARAQAWPTKPVRIVVPAAPGGSADPLARLVAEELGRALNQSFVVENRPGANGNVGAASVVKSPADGYTLLFGWTGTLVPAVTLYGAKPYHPQRDLDPIVLVGSVPNVIIVQPSLGVKTLAELTAHAKANPGKLNFGSTGSGSSYHLSGELYKKTVGVYMVHVPYNSPGAVLTDLVGDRLQLAFPGIAAAAPFVKDGRVRAVAVMADKRSDMMPDVPTTVELGYKGLVSDTWFGLLAPKSTPPDILKRINEVLNASLATPQVRDRLVSLGYQPLGGTPEKFASALEADIQKWGEVVKFSGAKVD